MGHSTYRLYAAYGNFFSADCWADNNGTEVAIRIDGSFADLLLSDSQIEALHAAIQQRISQIIARRMNEAQAAGKGCNCPEFAGESASCPVHKAEVA